MYKHRKRDREREREKWRIAIILTSIQCTYLFWYLFWDFPLHLMLFRFAAVVFATCITVGDAAVAIAVAASNGAAYTAIVVIAAVVFISNDLCRDETYYKNTLIINTHSHIHPGIWTHTAHTTPYTCSICVRWLTLSCSFCTRLTQFVHTYIVLNTLCM